MKNLTFGLYSSPNTVFTTKEISMILGENSLDKVKSRINYAVKKGTLVQLRRGIYAKVAGFEILEAANKIYTPSYISLETVLQKIGVVFQDYDRTIFVVSYQTREIEIGGYTVSFKKIKDEVLINQEGIRLMNGYSIATTERAFLDIVYLYKNYHFDNLSVVDWEKAEDLVNIYKSKALKRRFEQYVRNHRS